MKDSHKMIDVDAELITPRGLYDISVIRVISMDGRVYLDYLSSPDSLTSRVSLSLTPADLLKLKELLEPGPCMSADETCPCPQCVAERKAPQ